MYIRVSHFELISPPDRENGIAHFVSSLLYVRGETAENRKKEKNSVLG